MMDNRRSHAGIELIKVVMRINSLSNLPFFPLSPPFTIRTFESGNEQSWAQIETLAGEFPDLDRAHEHHKEEFGGKEDELRDRRFFLLDGRGHPIGTATAWYNIRFLSGDYGRLHWVAIVPDRQSRGLAKPLVAAAMQALALRHDCAYLTTQTTSYKAVRIYLDFGFQPYLVDDSDAQGWAILADILGEPSLARFQYDPNVKQSFT